MAGEAAEGVPVLTARLTIPALEQKENMESSARMAESFLVVDVPEGGLRLDRPDGSRGSMAGRWKLISMDAQAGARGGVRTDRPAGTEQAFVSWWCPPPR